MRQMLEAVASRGGILHSLPGGETRRPDWVIEDMQLLESHPDVRVEKTKLPGRKPYDGYDTMPDFYVKPGHTLRPELINLNYHSYVKDNWPHFSKLRTEFGLGNLPYQVTFPGTLNPSMFSFGKQNPVLGFKYRQAFEIAYKREVDAIMVDEAIGRSGRDKNDELVWQIEIPAEVGGMSKPPRFMQRLSNPLAAAVFARGVARQVVALPEGARVIIHTCPGDYHHKAYSPLQNTDLLVALSKAIIKHWPPGRELAGLHFPVASGDRMPSTEPEYYRSLNKLARVLPQNTRFIAGFVHERSSLEDLKKVLAIIERQLGRQVDIAYFCGLGRVSPSVARDVAQKCLQLAAT